MQRFTQLSLLGITLLCGGCATSTPRAVLHEDAKSTPATVGVDGVDNGGSRFALSEAERQLVIERARALVLAGGFDWPPDDLERVKHMNPSMSYDGPESPGSSYSVTWLRGDMLVIASVEGVGDIRRLENAEVKGPKISDEQTKEMERVLRESRRAQGKPEAQPGATDNPDDAQRLREDH